MEAKDLPHEFILFFNDEVPKKLTHFDVDSWDVRILDKFKNWRYWERVDSKTALECWERSNSKFVAFHLGTQHGSRI